MTDKRGNIPLVVPVILVTAREVGLEIACEKNLKMSLERKVNQQARGNKQLTGTAQRPCENTT